MATKEDVFLLKTKKFFQRRMRRFEKNMDPFGFWAICSILLFSSKGPPKMLPSLVKIDSDLSFASIC